MIRRIQILALIILAAIVGAADAQIVITPPASSSGAAVTGASSTILVNTTTVGNVGAGDDDLHVDTIPAGTLTTDGTCLRWTMVGNYAANANSKDPFNVVLTEGANITTVRDGGSNTGYNAGSQFAQVYICRTGATTVRTVLFLSQNLSNASAAFTVTTTTTGTYTWASAGTIKDTATGVADNDVITTFSMLEKVPPS